MSERILKISELPDDNALWLAIQFWGPKGSSELWNASKNEAGHTIIDVGDKKFIYDSLHKGLRAVLQGTEPLDITLTEPFDTSVCDLPKQ